MLMVKSFQTSALDAAKRAPLGLTNLAWAKSSKSIPFLLALLFHILRDSGKVLHSSNVGHRHTILEHQGK
jgi:hypothetical protein